VPQHGGLIPVFDARTNNISPAFDDIEAWRSIKYACCLCLRLKSHLAFDNHSILRVRFRKPDPECAEAQNETSWEPPCSARMRGSRLQADARSRTINGNTFKVVYYRTLREDSHDRTVRLAELYLTGIQRHKRACNECRFQRGDFARKTDSNAGNHRTPIIKSRPRVSADAIERYFPGVMPTPESTKDMPVRGRTYEEDRTTNEWATYGLRCPRCMVWQELANYRQGGMSHFKAVPTDAPTWKARLIWIRPNYWTWRCNRCVFEMGGPDGLGAELFNFWKALAMNEAETLRHSNRDGWQYMGELGPVVESLSTGNAAMDNAFHKAWTTAIKEHIHLPHAIAKLPQQVLQAKFDSWSVYVEGILKPRKQWGADPKLLQGLERTQRKMLIQWYERYPARAKRATMLEEQTKEFEAAPELLVAWSQRDKPRRE
jgi:hypothetical protein